MKKYVIGAVLLLVVIASVWAGEQTWLARRTIATADLGANSREYDTAYYDLQEDYETVLYRYLDVMNQDTVLNGETLFVNTKVGRGTVVGESVSWDVLTADTVVFNSSGRDSTIALDSLDLDAATLARKTRMLIELVWAIELDADAADSAIVDNRYGKDINVGFTKRY